MTEMDIAEENELTLKSYKIKDHTLDSLNIVYNESNSMFILWNKYQIFLYETENFEYTGKANSEFQIRQLIDSNNHVLCLDFLGNVHLTSLKFKNSAPKRFRSSFQPQAHNVLCLTKYDSDRVLCLVCESDRYYLILYQINADFKMDKKIELKFVKQFVIPQGNHSKYILYCHSLTKDFEIVKDIFNFKDSTGRDCNVVIISFDKMSVYGCLFHTKIDDYEISLVKLYTSPSEICDIKIEDTDNINILIGLTIGTIIRLPLTNAAKMPNIAHLNTALSKFITLKGTLIYTDGISMWKTENMFARQETKFYQFFAKHIKDFITKGDQLICTTYSNLIYMFPIEDQISYMKSVSTEEYCSAETVLSNAEYFHRIMIEIEKGDELKKKVDKEGSYLTALALSRRQDVMDKVIQNKIFVYENYEDAVKENVDVTLTEELWKYFKAETFFFLIQVTATVIHHVFSDVLSSLFGDIKIHITISSEQKILKTTSVKLNEPLKKVQVLIPLSAVKMRNTNQININIKLITNIPGALDERQTIWSVLYRKHITLSAVHFIKTNLSANNICLKDPEENVSDLILKTAINHHGSLFKFTDVTKQKSDVKEWSFYVKLPVNYMDILKTENYYMEHFHQKKANYLMKQFGADDFLKSKSNLCFEIGNESVKVEIINDFSNPMFKVTSGNMKLAFDVRNFFANMVYNDFRECGPGTEFVNNALYTTVENFKKSVQKCIADGTQEQLLSLTEEFQKNVIGALPI